jgi:two-component system, cell cycle response regulator
MLDDRPYAAARNLESAVAELERCAGSQFDPQVVEAFAAVLAERREAAEVPA